MRVELHLKSNKPNEETIDLLYSFYQDGLFKEAQYCIKTDVEEEIIAGLFITKQELELKKLEYI